jgi:hypothetical protein
MLVHFSCPQIDSTCCIHFCYKMGHAVHKATEHICHGHYRIVFLLASMPTIAAGVKRRHVLFDIIKPVRPTSGKACYHQTSRPRKHGVGENKLSLLCPCGVRFQHRVEFECSLPLLLDMPKAAARSSIRRGMDVSYYNILE